MHRSSALCRILALMVTGIACAHAFAGADNWVGKTIILKRNGNKIGNTDDNGNQVYVAKLTSISYQVLGDRDGWLKVRHGSQEGWFDKNEAVLAEDADAYFSALIRSNPNNDQYYARRGWAWHMLGEEEKAAADYTQALRIRPTEVDWLVSRGTILRDAKDYEGSLRDFNRALQLNPGAAYLYHNRGFTYARMKEYAKAIADCNRALQLEPDNSFAYNRRGITYNSMKDYDRAIQDFNEVIRLNPTYVWAFNNRGISYQRKGDYAKAIADYEKAIQLEPQTADPYANLGRLLAACPEEKYRDGKRALELTKKANELGHNKSPYHFDALAAAYAELGQFDEAIRWQEKALANPAYEREEGDDARKTLAAYRDSRPYRLAARESQKSTIPETDAPPKAARPTTIESGPLKGWKEWKAPDGSFAVAFPESPRAQKQRVPSAVGNVDNYGYYHEGVDAIYLAGYFDVPSDGLLKAEQVASTYAMGRKGRITSQKAIKLGEVRGEEVSVALPNGKVSRARFYESGVRRFQVVVEGPESAVTSEKATGFLNSFQVKR